MSAKQTVSLSPIMARSRKSAVQLLDSMIFFILFRGPNNASDYKLGSTGIFPVLESFQILLVMMAVFKMATTEMAMVVETIMC